MPYIQHRNAILAMICLFLMLSLSTVWFSHRTDKNNAAAAPPAQKPVPTVFVHGYKGTARSFNGMLGRLEKSGVAEKAMVIRVTKDGMIVVNGEISNRARHPMIQVIFSDNRASFRQTAGWLEKTMHILYTKYDVKEANLVGHSMGGLICTKYIEDTSGRRQYPVIQKLVTIGSPYEGVLIRVFKQNPNNTGDAARDLLPGSVAFKALYANKNRFSPHIQVLAIAGVVEKPALGDSLVSLDSALGGRFIVPKKQYTSKIVYGKNAQHSSLHENKRVDRIVTDFLWDAKK
ncbi:alpha/beta hydrolase [Heyndrickxia coagulans]|uniref:alpha/beta hydrolase n=1 Tax=Heyndrickxia coagulans TaxID=1398 RepID=UPI002DF9DB04|nr:alpha/beta hydrolase [Heyndrickxia coagulans]